MTDIIVNTNCSYCRFNSVEEMVEYYIRIGIAYNIKFAIREIVQSNIVYRNFLRENGYQATAEKLKCEAPSLMRIPNAFDIIDDWWRKIEAKGGLGNYDIQCYELTDTFTVFGKKIRGLDSLRKIVNTSRMNGDENFSENMRSTRLSSDRRNNKFSSLFAAEIWERYPCFDSWDYLNENRRFQCYYIRNHKICDDFFKDNSNVNLQNVVSEDIKLSDLPLVYYDGDSNVMYVLSPRIDVA